MKLVIFGLTVSSSWGNGHATLWRGLCASLARRGHQVVFFERDVPYYAETRDLTELPGGGELILYPDWKSVVAYATAQVRDCDAAIVTSYCPDAIASSELILESARGLKVFYDLDSPVTLARLRRGEAVDYVSPRGFRDFDLVLSYAGGRTLDELTSVLGAKRVAPLYGSVDPCVHKPVAPDPSLQADLSYLGTYSPERDEALNSLLIEPARQSPARKFLIGGSLYGEKFPWLPNLYFVNHVEPARHPAFYCSSLATLNVTRRPMAELGYCPSGRIFEAAACGVPVLTDSWEGLESFFKPGEEILVGSGPADTLNLLQKSPAELKRIAAAARERTLACHTADRRVEELEQLFTAMPEAGAACGA